MLGLGRGVVDVGRQDVHARGGDVGLEDVRVRQAGATRREIGHHRGDDGRRCGRRADRAGGCCAVGGDIGVDRCPGGQWQVDGGHRVEVSHQAVGGCAGVEQHHACTAHALDLGALVDPGADAPVADHNLADGCGGTQLAGKTAPGIGHGSACGRNVLRQHHRAGQHAAKHRHPIRVERAVAGGEVGQGLTVMGGSRHRHQPGAHVSDLIARAAVARRRRHEHTRGGGIQVGDLDRIDVIGLGAADRVIDDVHAVSHRIVNRLQDVGVVATIVGGRGVGRPQRFVDGDAGAGCHARDAADGGAIDGGVHSGVATRGGRGVRAVAGAVAR